MDRIIGVQYRRLVEAMAAQGIEIEAERDADGRPRAIYRAERMVTAGDANDVDRLADHLGHAHVDVVPDAERVAAEGITELKVSGMSVGEAVDRIVAREADRAGLSVGDPPLAEVAPDHVIHICRLCPATEPLKTANPRPLPAVRTDEALGRDVFVIVADTGLTDFDPKTHWWMRGVTGERAGAPRPGPGEVATIGKYEGHGTFVAGVVRTMAPGTEIVVGDHMQTAEAALNSRFCNKLAQMIAAAPRSPDILVLSAGTLTRGNGPSIAWQHFHKTVMKDHPNMVLIAAAGNNGDNDDVDRPFWPAAFDWAYGVGALKSDQRTRAAFSNLEGNAKVFVQGENMVNAFPNGVYTYDEDPDTTPATFTNGMAEWSGTSFATPLFAGMVAARMTRHGQTAQQAARDLVGVARGQVVPGIDLPRLTVEQEI